MQHNISCGLFTERLNEFLMRLVSSVGAQWFVDCWVLGLIPVTVRVTGAYVGLLFQSFLYHCSVGFLPMQLLPEQK